MRSLRRNVLLALLVSALFAAAPAVVADPPNFFFIHVPPHDSGTSQDDIDQGLKDIGMILEENWKQGHPGEGDPKVCWLGFNGPWEEGGANEPNSGGQAANDIGNASDMDNQCGAAMPISYCAVDGILDDQAGEESECDIVIGLGEGSPDGFCLEEHGDPAGDPVPDCEGSTPEGPVCSGEGCEGTDWDDPSYEEEGQTCEPCDFQDLVRCKYDGPVDIKPADGAGNFLCGYFCCWRSTQEEEPKEPVDETTTGRSIFTGF